MPAGDDPRDRGVREAGRARLRHAAQRRRWRRATWPRRPTMPRWPRPPAACSAAATAPGVFVARDADLGAALRSRLTPDMAASDGRGRRRVRAPPHGRRQTSTSWPTPSNTPPRVRRDVPRGRRLRRAVEPDRRVRSRRLRIRRAPAGGRRDGGPRSRALRVDGHRVSRGRGAAAGGRLSARRAATPAPLDISAGWRVTFGPHGHARRVEHAAIVDRRRGDAALLRGREPTRRRLRCRRRCWAAAWRVTLDLGAPKAIDVGRLRTGTQAWIDAPVREAAVVFVNGRRAGSAWCPPYAVDVTPLLRPGPNVIRIEVANLAINHMAGRALPDYKLLNLRYGTRFEPAGHGQGAAGARRASSARSASWPRRPRRGMPAR
ncbi:MAG: hypothetical protein MZW92_42370 [Comamonadaceae bacterium]|nr:hypothetical protein [Comamonadaceae bacterium]